MPYKATNEWVMVKRKGKWVKLRKATSAAAARRQARALNATAGHATSRR